MSQRSMFLKKYLALNWSFQRRGGGDVIWKKPPIEWNEYLLEWQNCKVHYPRKTKWPGKKHSETFVYHANLITCWLELLGVTQHSSNIVGTRLLEQF